MATTGAAAAAAAPAACLNMWRNSSSRTGGSVILFYFILFYFILFYYWVWCCVCTCVSLFVNPPTSLTPSKHNNTHTHALSTTKTNQTPKKTNQQLPPPLRRSAPQLPTFRTHRRARRADLRLRAALQRGYEIHPYIYVCVCVFVCFFRCMEK